MQVAKIVFTFVLAMAMFLLASCVGNRITAEDARAVNPEDYGSLEGNTDYSGYRLEEFMADCGAVVAFQNDGANILAGIGVWKIQIETYMVESGLADPFWCSQVFVYRDDSSIHYAFGHLKGATPRLVSQPERVLVRDAGKKPWRQRIEKTTLEDLIKLMNSGNLLENQENPLEGLGFTYLETDRDGNNWEHQPGSEPKQVTGVSAIPPAEAVNSK